MSFGMKYGENAKLCYIIWILTYLFIVQVKTDDVYKSFAGYVETRFETLNYELEIPLPKRKNKKVIGVTTDDLSGKIMKEFFQIRGKTYSSLIDYSSEDKKARSTKTLS